MTISLNEAERLDAGLLGAGPETLAVINTAYILLKHYFNQSKYYLRSHHFHL